MKKRGILAVAAILALAVVVAGCGGSALDTYKSEMQSWVDTYQADLTESVAGLETITDPMNPTAEEIQSAKDFTDLMGKAVSDLEGIEAPSDIAADHTAYAEGLKSMQTGFQIFVEAMETGDLGKFQEAMTALAASAEVETAETALEEALGFKLTED